MNLTARIHQRYVFARRLRILIPQLLDFLPERASILDVGSGDGSIAAGLSASRPNLKVDGIDVLVRRNTKIPVIEFDGRQIPFQDDAFDIVMFVDVLHHTTDPTELLKEARRVARYSIVLKDHFKEGWLANSALKLMDWVGNAGYGVSLPYTYWGEARWRQAFEFLDLEIDQLRRKINLYPWPASLVFDRNLQFIASLRVSRSRP
jgi:SAM-dependent methyltransferase